jgi:hypothetical protein
VSSPHNRATGTDASVRAVRKNKNVGMALLLEREDSQNIAVSRSFFFWSGLRRDHPTPTSRWFWRPGTNGCESSKKKNFRGHGLGTGKIRFANHRRSLWESFSGLELVGFGLCTRLGVPWLVFLVARAVWFGLEPTRYRFGTTTTHATHKSPDTQPEERWQAN